MDILCPVCREPWDTDSLHEEVAVRYPNKPWYISEEDTSDVYSRFSEDNNGWYSQRAYEIYWNEVKSEFYRIGCKALRSFNNGVADYCQPKPSSNVVRALYDLAGDDIDFAASMMEDAEAWGLFDD